MRKKLPVELTRGLASIASVSRVGAGRFLCWRRACKRSTDLRHHCRVRIVRAAGTVKTLDSVKCNQSRWALFAPFLIQEIEGRVGPGKLGWLPARFRPFAIIGWGTRDCSKEDCCRRFGGGLRLNG